jgi:hypothetical protein
MIALIAVSHHQDQRRKEDLEDSLLILNLQV